MKHQYKEKIKQQFKKLRFIQLTNVATYLKKFGGFEIAWIEFRKKTDGHTMLYEKRYKSTISISYDKHDRGNEIDRQHYA